MALNLKQREARSKINSCATSPDYNATVLLTKSPSTGSLLPGYLSVHYGMKFGQEGLGDEKICIVFSDLSNKGKWAWRLWEKVSNKKINTALIQLQLLVGHFTDGWLGHCVVIQSDKIHSVGQNTHTHTHTHRCLKMPHRKIHLMVLSEDERMMKQFNLVEIDCNSPRLARWFQSFAKSYFANTLHHVLARRVIYQPPVMRSRSHEWSHIIGPITPSFTSPSSRWL